MVSERAKAWLLGLGLDKDKENELVRVTRAENYLLLGGSKDTHESMQEKCVKFNEKLGERGKSLEDLEKQEFLDIAAACDMNVAIPKPRPYKKDGK